MNRGRGLLCLLEVNWVTEGNGYILVINVEVNRCNFPNICRFFYSLTIFDYGFYLKSLFILLQT